MDQSRGEILDHLPNFIIRVPLEILGFSKGSLVVLDKLAGDQVDLFVNGKCIAKGDVVVIDDNFGIRITEIVKKPGLMDSIKK